MLSKQLFIIRIALVTGVMTFAALAAYQRVQQPVSHEAMAMVPLGTMRYALWALAIVAVLIAIFLKARIEGGSTPGANASMTIIGWAFGEGVALFGTVQHFLGGPVATMALGLLSFVVVLILLPVPRTPTRAG